MPSESPKHFDATSAASYDQRWAPLFPLRDSLHLQIGLLLQDLPAEARVLCVGAGTGAELVALARLFPAWRFVALDPSEPMLTICRQRAKGEGIVSRCEFHAGYVDDLPDRQEFHASTSLLVSHFLTETAQRTAFFRGIARRLRPGGRLVTAELCAGETTHSATLLMELHRRMMNFSRVPAEQVTTMSASYGRDVAVSPAEEIVRILIAAGFESPVAFSQQMMMRAWHAQTPA